MNNYDFSQIAEVDNANSWFFLKNVLRIHKKLQQIPGGNILAQLLTGIMNLITNYDFRKVAEWNNIPGFISLQKAKQIQKVAKNLPSNATLVELGSYKGRSAVAVASILPEGGTLYCVDHFQGSPEMTRWKIDCQDLLTEFSQNIKFFGVEDRIDVLVMTTTQAAKKFEPESIDMILIDAGHDYNSVKADLLSWYPKLKPHGFLFCDDYEPTWHGVVKAIEDVGLEGKIAAPSLWIHQKPKSDK